MRVVVDTTFEQLGFPTAGLSKVIHCKTVYRSAIRHLSTISYMHYRYASAARWPVHHQVVLRLLDYMHQS
jgi:hypothetical protein